MPRLRAELLREPRQDIVDRFRADHLVELEERVVEEGRLHVPLVAVDEGVADLVQQPESDDLAGVRGGRSAGCPLVQPGCEAAGGRRALDEELALRPEVRVELVRLPGGPPDA